MLIFSLIALINLLKYFGLHSNTNFENYLIGFVIAVLIYGTGYKGLLQKSEVFSLGHGKKYKKSALTKEIKTKYMETLTNYFKNEKPYLKSTITIQEVSKKIRIPVNHLSQVINEQFGYNFNDFINSYRIENAKNLLQQQNSSANILEVMLESGFNSKSVFNTAFKKFTNLTPTEYKKKVNENK